MLNEDYRDILLALSEEGVRFLLVGAHAMAAYGYPRLTMDIDLWVEPTLENAKAVMRALDRFGAPRMGLTVEDLACDDIVFQIGVEPQRIDLLTGITGVSFPEAFHNSIEKDLEGVSVRVLALEDLIKNKKATGRKKDLLDIDAIEALKIDK
jgi:predicted nucleotidyltransferase